MNCQNCGAESQPGDSTCARCGTALATPAPTPPDSLPLATPWPRYWARALDLVLWTILLGILLGVFMPQILDTSDRADERLREQLLGVVLLPFAMAGDAVTYMLFGNTPGKWVAGLRVRDVSGQKLTPLRYLRRSSGVYLNGLALGLGLIAIFTLIHQYRRASSGALTSWDERNDSRVQHVRGGLLRTGVTAALVVTLAAGSTGLGEYLGTMSPEDQLRLIATVANQGTPTMIDTKTRLDRVSVVAGNVVQYDYTLLDVSAGETEGTALYPGSDGDTRREIAKQVCHDLSFVFDQDGHVRFRYADRQGKLLGAIDISRSDCTQKT
jgi:uncharacterized RDD family membrane protein YckC